jgi:tetratricopeptide (TPR) repeat protein
MIATAGPAVSPDPQDRCRLASSSRVPPAWNVVGHRILHTVLTALLALGCLLAPPCVDQAVAQPADASVFVARAIIAYQERRFEEALAELREALALDPRSVDAHYYSGLALVALGRRDEAAQALEQARALAPGDDGVLFQLGGVYFSQGRIADARPLLEEAFARSPRREGLGQLVGLLRYQQGDYSGALRALNEETSTDPDIQQTTRLYRGLVLAQMGVPERAQAEVEEAIRIAPRSALTAPAERMRDTIIATSESQRRFTIELRAGVYYDTNVPVSPLPSGDPVSERIRLANREEKESPGELLAARFDYAWLRRGPWESTIGYSFYQTLNNDASDFNIQDHLVLLSGFYRDLAGGFPYQIGAQYAFDYTLLGGDSYLIRQSGTLFGSLAESSRHLTTLLGRIESKDYTQETLDPNESQTGINYLVGVNHTIFFSGRRHLIRVGYQWDLDDTDGRNYEYRGNRLLAGFMYTLPFWNMRLRFDFDVHFKNYQNLNTILPASAPGTVKRDDTELNYVTRLELPLPRGLTLALEYLHTNNDSNLAAYKYDRDVITMLMSWLY